MKVKRIQLPLFWKFSIAIASTVILFGSLNLLFIRNQVYKTFENQIEKHGISIALSIAERAVEPILYDDLSALNKLLVQTKNVNGDVKYIFIIDNEKQLIAHTFSNYTPKGIIDVNPIAQGMVKNVLILESENKAENVRDIAIPILDGQLGFVRVGMCEGAFLNEIRSITQLFLIMVFFFLLLGLIAALLLSYIITSPLKAISSYASKVDFNSINHEVKSNFDLNDELSVRLKNLFSLTDEIDILGVTFNDMISRLHTAYKELKNTQESLSQTEKMASVGTLTAGLAHEINNPLAGIRNCMRRIEDKPENIRQNAEYIALMSEALEKIEKVVEGMLNFSRKQELLFTEADINVLFNNSLNLVNYQLQQSKITLTNLLGDEPILVNASPNHLEQVFVNVLLNSIDAINERKEYEPNLIGSLTIKSKESSSGVTIDISDNGVGVPPDKVISIFDPFFTFKKIKQGTGLGLAVSYNIINSHNGTISGWNEPTGGFTITIYLPKTIR